MPMTMQFDGVNFGCQPIRDDDGKLTMMLLNFIDPSGVMRVVVPFTPEAWENFKRQAAADGEVPTITLAREMPRMDVPKGK